jgi:general secretion pathway protein F
VTPNIFVRSRIEYATEREREGTSLRDAISAAGRIPPKLVAMIASGEAGGDLGEMLCRAAEDHQRDPDAWICTLVSLVEPAFPLLMGGLVMIMMLAILLPIMSIDYLVGI